MPEVWSPAGATISIAATNVAGTGVQVTGPTTGGRLAYRMVNHNVATPAVVRVGYGVTAAVAQAQAAAPNGALQVITLLPNSAEVIWLAPGLYFSAVTIAGTTIVEITAGQGA